MTPAALAGIDRALAHARRHPGWSAERIANLVWRSDRMAPWITVGRQLDQSEVPALTEHHDVVRWAYRVATILGWVARPEHAIALSSSRRIIPDLTIQAGFDGPVHFVVEVKPRLASPGQIASARRQVTRYADHIAAQPGNDGVRAAMLAPVNRFVGTADGLLSWDLKAFVDALQDGAS